ncbi:MAG: carbamoyl phosphate synthase small subunit [Defluviitaleaceae bacterium]|nr:carbamoyl phosphate synthase small subunit [Defluviitaleaceae bacterium]
MTAYLTLENGATFQGEFFGKPLSPSGEITGDVVFSTGMTGYLETMTDPAVYGQVVVQTFPLIGNYGVISADLESDTIHAKAYIVKYLCQVPSNFRSEEALDTFFMQKGVTGVKGIDTRALTKIIREKGALRGKITTRPLSESEAAEIRLPGSEATNAIAAVSAKTPAIYGEGKLKVALLDLGVKHSTIRHLTRRGCQVHVFPYNTGAEAILAINPQGICLSSGPGNPAAAENAPIVETIRALQARGIPMFAMGMGHLLLALANGYQTEKMAHGHHGANQPVKDMATGRVYITAQHHGYAVAAPNPAYQNVNDGTCEGLDYGHAFSVQFDPGVGPKDTEFIFDQFTERVKAYAAG